MLTSLQRSRSSSIKRGFTLIELLVVVGIMVVITSTLLLRQQQFNSSTLLRSLAYSVALSIRQAQTYGVSVLGVSGDFTAQSYGIHFNGPATSGAACPKITSYVLFADTGNKGYFDASATVIKTFTFNQGYYVSNFAVQEPNTGSGIQYDCMCAGTLHLGNGLTAACAQYPRGSLDIMFRRPNPDACFALTNTSDLQPPITIGGTTCVPGASQSNYPLGFIQVNSLSGATRGIRINTTGEIEVTQG